MRSCIPPLQVVLVIVSAVAQLDRTQIHFNDPQILPDGILVLNDGETQRHAATWTILISLDAPKTEEGLRLALHQIRTVITSLQDHRSALNSTRKQWESRIQEIEDAMIDYMSERTPRTRRGLLNIVGQISQKLFGTATEEQVNECRRLINQMDITDKKINHSVTNLITIINQTHDQLKENRQHITNIEAYLNDITQEVHYIQDIMQKQEVRIEFIDSEIKIDQALSMIENAHHRWLRQLDKYNRQKASLELGWLTEEVLPPAELGRIIRAGRRAGFHAPPSQWYYEHISIEPMWADEERLVFHAQLPFTDDVRYLRYRIRSWPVPGNSSDADVKVQLPTDIAIHTENGDLFQPVSCLGRMPTICRTGPVYDRSRFPCPRGILTGEEALRAKCKVTLVKRTETETEIEEALAGTFILRTQGVECSLHCSGRPEKRPRLAQGVHIIRLSTDCLLRRSRHRSRSKLPWNIAV